MHGTNSPVRICKIKQVPKRDPKCHHDEVFDGAGRSRHELTIIVISEWDFRILVINVLIVKTQTFSFHW